MGWDGNGNTKLYLERDTRKAIRSRVLSRCLLRSRAKCWWCIVGPVSLAGTQHCAEFLEGNHRSERQAHRKKGFYNLWKATLLSPCLVLWPNRSSTIGITQDVRGCQIKKIFWTTQGRVVLYQSLANTSCLRYPSYSGLIRQEKPSIWKCMHRLEHYELLL